MLYAYKKAPHLIYIRIELNKKLMTDLELNRYTHSYIIKQPPSLKYNKEKPYSRAPQDRLQKQ